MKWTLLIISLNVALINTGELYTIKSLSPGLLYENIGSIQVKSSSWKITSYINLTIYFSELQYVQSLVENINQQCNLLRTEKDQEVLCDKIVRELEDDIRELEGTNKYFIPSTKNRVKRGQVNIVGSGMKFLFGTMDQSDADYYKAHIEAMEHGQETTNNILENQKTILSSTFDKLNEVVEHLNEQDQTMDQLKAEVEIMNRSHKKTEYFTRIHYLFDDLSIYIKISIDKVRRDQQKLFDIINAANYGLSHPSIFDPHELMNVIKEISTTLRETIFPLPLIDENLYKIISLGEFVAVFMGEILVFEVSIPLLDPIKFKMYKMTTIPEEIKNQTFSYIQPEGEILGMNEQADKYFFTDNIQLKIYGKLVSKDTYFMNKKDIPIYMLHSRPSCETIFFTQGILDKEYCLATTKIIKEELWFQLNEPNTYIFTFPKSTLISIVCEKEIRHDTLVGVGMIKTNNCGIRTNYVTLSSDESGKSNYSMEIRSLNKLETLSQIERQPDELKPTAITSRTSISLLGKPTPNTQGKDSTTATSKSGFCNALIITTLVFLFISVLLLYIFAFWLWNGANKYLTRKRQTEEKADEREDN